MKTKKVAVMTAVEEKLLSLDMSSLSSRIQLTPKRSA